MNDHPLNTCLSLDLEVGKRDARIHALATVRRDTDERLVFPSGNLTLTAALTRLDRLADSADVLLGHNLILAAGRRNRLSFWISLAVPEPISKRVWDLTNKAMWSPR